ncbi:MAG TPA: STAS domain-containing protein [Azonexus sp.]|nr:STAS domain-containing protein [Azonexus sp.]
MVFSFFKKQAQKMPERPAARPRPPAPEVRPENLPPAEPEPLAEPLPDLEFTVGNRPSPTPKKPEVALSVKPTPASEDLDFTGEDFDREFTESSVMGIDVDHGGDPLQGDIEHVVVLFANAQDAAARSLLETLVRTYPGSEGKRFWLLLFDLLQSLGERAAFEKLGMEYAEVCETSPPAWRQEEAAVVSKVGGGRQFVLQGVLTAEGAQPVAELGMLIAQKVPVIVDCARLVGCDDDVAGELADMLTRARHADAAVTLLGVEGFLGRLNERLVAGEATRATTWLLLLELLQRHGTQETFEERAVDYAVTFELSPPSWEAVPPVRVALPAVSAGPSDDAYYFSGELKNYRFDELLKVFEEVEIPILDFAGVRRMDFFSAGQLVNRIAPFKAKGRDIVIRSPSHLVAELMAVVGLNKQARIIVPKS